jgi:acyl carrier protein
MNEPSTDTYTKAVYEILVEQLDVTPSQINLDSKIQEDLGADSLDVMEIIMAVEERFQITIPDEESEKVRTVGDLLEALDNILANR